MSVDREQVRRDARFHADHSASTPVTKSLARDCLALLAELEQAKRVRAEYDRELEVRTRALEQAERDLADCRRAGVSMLERAEQAERDDARLAAVPALVEVGNSMMRHLPLTPLSRAWHEALAAYEQAQKP